MSNPCVGAGEVPVTASAIVAEAAGSHILRIQGYSRTKGLGNGKCLSAEKFAVEGYSWNLEYYPAGQSSNNRDWISFCLNHDYVNFEEVKAKFTISLLDQDGNPVPSYSMTSPWCTFSCGQRRIGYNLIKRRDLDESDYLKDDVFSVRCDVSVVPKCIFNKVMPVPAVRRCV